MKKSGFTLAEVLITLGIIGVVAALTAPALISSSRNEANAARLAVIVSNIENATHSMLVQEDVDNIYMTAFGRAGIEEKDKDGKVIDKKDALAGNLARYMHTNGRSSAADSDAYYASTGYFLMANDGSRGTSAREKRMKKKNQTVITLKNGATLFISPGGGSTADLTEAAAQAAANAGRSIISDAFDVFIDVNGPSAPNVIGRDIFAFYMGENGMLYPLGGADIASLEEKAGKWDAAGHAYSCTDSDKASTGYGCTARVIEEGYKINY